METETQRIRLATVDDCAQIESAIAFTLAKPEGKGRRTNHSDGVLRNEVLVVERLARKEQTWRLCGFLEWHTRLDGTTTIRDVGTVGESPEPALVKGLVRELIMSQAPPTLRVKMRADQPAWNQIFGELPGFYLEGKEFVRPYWRNIWVRQRKR